MRIRISLAAVLLGLAAHAAGPVAHREPGDGIVAANINANFRPQDDLYRHVNGHWLATTAIPADRSNYGAFTVLSAQSEAQLHQLLEEAVARGPQAGKDERKAADLYRSMLDTARIEALATSPLQADLARIAAIATPADLAAWFGHAQRIGARVPLAWFVSQDKRDARHYAMYLYQAGLTLPERDYYLRDDAAYQDYRAKFRRYVGSLLTGAGVAQTAGDADTVLRLETALARAQWTRVQNRDPVATYNRMNAADLVRLAPGIDWAAFFAAVGSPVEPVVVYQPAYLTALGQLVRELPLADWRTWLRFQLIDSRATLLNAKLDTLHFEFHDTTLQGVKAPKPRWRRGAELVNGLAGEISGRMYVEKYFSADSKRRMQQLVGNLLAAYNVALDTLDWMEPASRAAAREKLAKFGVKIGYPDHWRDYSALTVRADDLYGNVMRAQEFEHQRSLKKLASPVDRTEWATTTTTVNASYNATQNAITFPAAILQPPFFNPDADDAVNYGAIGSVIGHEISHGFDDSGRQYDGDGNLHDWWSDTDARRYQERAQKVVAQFAACTILDGQHMDGEFTLGENIADNAGLSIAWQAWQRSLGGRPAAVINGRSGAQRFFFGLAQVWPRNFTADNLRFRLTNDPHAVDEFRVNVTPTNLAAFYEAFDVREGDRLYRRPEDRVVFW